MDRAVVVVSTKWEERTQDIDGTGDSRVFEC